MATTTQPPEDGAQQQNAPRQQPRLSNTQSGRQQQQPRHHQGVLWKRRDVFKNKWRPRWFVLQPEEAVLTYYLLSKSDGAAAASTISTPLRRSSNSNIGAITTTTANSSPTNTGGPPALTQEEATNANTTTNANSAIVNNNVNHSTHSNVSELTTDLRSIVSENPVDYEVVPRGAIYLPGCRVGANDALSVPSQGLYVLTIVPPPSSGAASSNKDNTHCHLAARTGEARAVWVENLRRAAFVPTPRVASTRTMTNSNANININNNTGNTDDDDNNIGNTDEGTPDNNANNDLNLNEAEGTSWKSISPHQTLFDNVPETLAARIEQTLENHLELCDDDGDEYGDPNPTSHPRNHHHWKPIFEHRQEGNPRNNSDTGIITDSSAYQRQDLQGRTLLKSTAIIPHHPKQVMSLLLDSKRRPDYEANVAHSERLKILNNHTFLDYYAYKAVWPTSPRDFAVVVHWQALQRQQRWRRLGGGETSRNNSKDEALVTLAFSCSEAEELVDSSSTAPHVRAKLHASFYLLRLIPPSSTTSTPRCHLTRILSLDLGGALPRNLQQAVLMQQAGLPGVLSKHLQQVEPTPAPNLSTNDAGPMTNDTVIQDVLHSILQQDNDDTLSSTRRRLDFDDNAIESGPGTTRPDVTISKVDNHFGASGSGASYSELSLPSTAAILLLPVLVHRLLSTSGLPLLLQLSERVGYLMHPATLFCISAFLAVRYVVVSFLGSEIQQQQKMAEHMVDGPTTCTLSVDLKKVQRYIATKQERGKDGSTDNGSAAVASNQAEISVLHVVAAALTKAMQKHATCWNYRRVIHPLLFVDGYYRYPNPKITVSVSASDRLLTLEDFQFKNVQAVANALSAAEKRLEMDDTQRMGMLSALLRSLSMLFGFPKGRPCQGRCLIVLTKVAANADNQTSSSSDVSGVEITQCQLPDDLDILVVVGGIRLHRSTPAKALPPKPIMSLSLTINTASVLDVAKCSVFAEDLQKFIQFPELCDD